MNQSRELAERVKELQCMYKLSELVQQEDLNLSDLLQRVARFIPLAWQYPESACARIIYEGQTYVSENFQETSWRQISYIPVANKKAGSVEVFYLEEKHQEDEGPFLAFERKLIENIAKLLAETIERRHAEEESQRLLRQHAALTQLSLQALKDVDLSVLLNEAVKLTARILNVGYCQILERPPERDVFLLRAATGWSEEEVGKTVQNLDTQSQAGYTFLRNESVMSPDLEKESRFRDLNLLQKHHLISGMSVLIHGTNSPFGVLAVHTEHARTFEQDELNFLESIANIVGSAVERAKAGRAMKEYQSQLRTLASQLSLAEQKERLRIATELHDVIAQNLAMTKMKLSELQKLSLPDNVVFQVQELRTLLEETIRSTRSLSFDLSPPVLHDLGLEAALDWLAERTEQEHSIRIQFEDDGSEKPLDENLRNLLFTMVRELIFNVVKHAKAAEAKISVGREGNQIQIEVQDKGCGFDVSAAVAERNDAGGFGLFSITERLRYFGGRLAIQSKPGSGTRVRLTAPLNLRMKDKEE
jgi:signal transduction histidine kinase